MYEDIKKKIFEKITEYDTIILCRHIRPDGDAFGSTLAMRHIINASFPEKRVFIDRDDETENLAFMGEEGELPTDNDFNDALVIILDTAVIKRISSKRAFTGKEIIKIDHHIIETDFGDISWVEPERNSVCEMITEFWSDFKDRLVLTYDAASCLFTGIVTDTGRFKFRGTSPKTLRLSALLLEKGIYFQSIYTYLDVKEYKQILDESDLVKMIRLTPAGAAYLFLTKEVIDKYKLTAETSYDAVKLMEQIKGSLIWLVFIENDDGSYRVRIRSRFVEVEPVARKYSGGGHACAAGATVYSDEEAKNLLNDLDLRLADFKKGNPDLF